jgi:hypothetical protein
MKKPIIKICKYEELVSRKYSDDEAVIIISSSLSEVEEVKGIAELILLLLFSEEENYLLSTKGEEIEEEEDIEEKTSIGSQCSLEEIEGVVDFANAIDDYRIIFISDPGDLSRSWNIALGLNYLYTHNIREALSLTVRERPEVRPTKIWPAMLFDEFFKLNNRLVQEVDDYFVTGMVIDSKGNVIHSKWFDLD